MQFPCTISRLGNGRWTVRHTSPDLGTIETVAASREEAIEKMRGSGGTPSGSTKGVVAAYSRFTTPPDLLRRSDDWELQARGKEDLAIPPPAPCQPPGLTAQDAMLHTWVPWPSVIFPPTQGRW
jgi:hypothetical protein